MDDARNKKLDLLRRIGADEWFLCSEKYKKFLNWFCTNVTEEMLYTETELRQYRDLLDENSVLTADQLDRQSQEFEADLADIALTDAEHAELKTEIQLCKDIDAELAKLIEDTKKTNSKTVQQITATQLRRQRIQTEEQALTEQCLATAGAVQTAQLENQRRIRDLNRFYAADQLTPVFVHQMGMHQYYQQCDAFCKYLDQYMQNNFRLQNGGADDAFDAFDDSCGSANSGHGGGADASGDSAATVGQLEIINHKLYRSSIELARQQMNWAAYQKLHRSDVLDKWQLPGGGGSASGRSWSLAAETAELRQLNEGYLAAELENALDALTFVLRQLAGLQVEQAAYENTRAKLRRAATRLAMMRQVQQVVADDLLNAEVVWLLMQFDLERLRSRGVQGVLEGYGQEAMAVARRTELMQRAVADGCGRAQALNSWFMAAVRQAIGVHAPQVLKMGGVEVAGGAGAYERLMLMVGNSLRALSAPQMHWEVAEQLKEVAQQEASYNSFVRASPNAQLVLYDLHMKNQLHAIRLLVSEIESQIGEFKANYINQYTTPMNKNKFMQAKRLLWVYYLTEPKMLLRVIKSIKLAAKAVASQPAPSAVAPAAKSISGIMRKN